MPPRPGVPAAQYVRMSTDDQQFSIANQQAAISRYAEQNAFTVVETYSDPGRSGVVIRRRPGLNRLLGDVVSGRACYKAILVYDVSRWGRFQDTDEAAHYEFLCKQAGIPVHYCAETFPNDGTISSSILKALKRTMAGEYSRELGVKVYEGKRRIALSGFRVGGHAGFGFRRMMISRSGTPKQVLEKGQYKALQDDRVVLVLGPQAEIRLVRQIFRMALKRHMGPTAIARELNCQKRVGPYGGVWTHHNVYWLLTNPKYCGCHVWGRTTQRMRSGCRRVGADNWTVCPAQSPGIVSRKTYDGVQRFFAERFKPKTDEQLLAPLRRMLKRHGKICGRLLHKAGLDENVYRRRFGSLTKTYARLGWRANKLVMKRVELHIKVRNLKKDLIRQLQHLAPGHITAINRYSSAFQLDGTPVLLCIGEFRRTQRRKKPRWLFKIENLDRHTLVLLCTIKEDYSGIRDVFLRKEIGTLWGRKYVVLKDRHWWLDHAIRLHELGEFFVHAQQLLEKCPERKQQPCGKP